MSLQFILGNGKKDHRQVLIDEASAWLDQDASNQVFFLVPNYSKFEQEQEILAEMRRRREKSFQHNKCSSIQFLPSGLVFAATDNPSYRK